jgi:general secretion pathway protein C
MGPVRRVVQFVLLAALPGCGGPPPPTVEPMAVVAPPPAAPPAVAAPPVAPAPAPAAAPGVPRTEVRLDREWVERLREGDGRIWGSARIEPTVDGRGRPVGLTLLDLRPDGLYGSAGLREGDIVKAVNGMPLTSEAHALEAYRALRAATRVELLVERRGAPLVLVVVLGE